MRSLIIQLVNRHSYFASTKWIYIGVLWDMIAAMFLLVQIHLILQYKFGLPRLALYIHAKSVFLDFKSQVQIKWIYGCTFALRQRKYDHFIFSLTVYFYYFQVPTYYLRKKLLSTGWMIRYDILEVYQII